MSFAIDFQGVIFEKLRNSVDLNLLVSQRIYDFASQKVLYPYVSLGENIVTISDTSTTRGAVVDVSIHTWSQSAGKKETEKIISAIYQALHQTTAEGRSCHFLDIQITDTQSFIDSDGITRHGVIDVKAYLDQN